MELYYSRVDTSRLLHLVCRKAEFRSGRVNLADPREYLQLAALRLERGTTFRAHKHRLGAKATEIAQESWVVIEGAVEAMFYDLDDRLLGTSTLEPGDASLTFYGGHNYRCLRDAFVYEFKTGPYLGQELDKEFL